MMIRFLTLIFGRLHSSMGDSEFSQLQETSGFLSKGTLYPLGKWSSIELKSVIIEDITTSNFWKADTA